MRRPVTVLFHDRTRREPTNKPGTFESVIKTLGGIAGTVAVFSTLLSVFGFLLLRSHSNLLGLSNFLDHSVTDYLYEGAGFAGYSFYSVVELFIGHFRVVLAAAVILLAARALVRRARRYWRRAGKAEKWGESARKLSAWACLLPAIVSIIYFTYQSLPPTQAKDLLFSSGDHEERLRRTDARLGELEASYINALRYFILSGGVVWAAYFLVWGASSGGPSPDAKNDKGAPGGRQPRPARVSAGRALIAAQAVLFLLVVSQLLLLPMTYGQTVYSNRFHKVKELVVEEALKARIPGSDNVWLIKENPDYFILYYRDEYTLRLIKKDELKSLSLEGRENIFDR